MGVVLGVRLLGHPIPERVAGIDLFHQLLIMSAKNNWSIFLLGAELEIVEKTARIVTNQYSGLQVAGFHHGYFWDDEVLIVNKIKVSGAKLLFVAITSPKKENFINQWQEQLGVTFVMGVGGTFDVKGKTCAIVDAKIRFGMVISRYSRAAQNVEKIFSYEC